MSRPKGYSLHFSRNPSFGACDAAKLAALAKTLGYEHLGTHVDENATRKAFFEGLNLACRKMTGGDILFLTISAHGQVDFPYGNNKCPRQFFWLSHPIYDHEVRDALLRFHKKSRIFVLADTCFSGDIIDWRLEPKGFQQAEANQVAYSSLVKNLGNFLEPLENTCKPESNLGPTRILLAATGAQSTFDENNRPLKGAVTFDDWDAGSGLLPEALLFVLQGCAPNTSNWPSYSKLAAACVDRTNRYFRPAKDAAYVLGSEYLPPQLYFYPPRSFDATHAPAMII